MQQTKQEQLQDFQIEEGKDDLENLIRFLEPYGLDTGDLSDEKHEQIFNAEDQTVDVGLLLNQLPETLEDGENGAYVEMKRFYKSIPRTHRAAGADVDAKNLLSLLIERTEFFGHLTERVARTCRGQQCSVYEACPHTDGGDGLQFIENATPEDSVTCMVDRQELNDLKDYLLQSANNPDGKIDPRRSVQALLFERLAGLIVTRRRIFMKLQQEDLTVEVLQAVQTQGSGVEQLREAGTEAHPLLEAFEANMRRIESVMDNMGISPQFEMRNDRWIEEDDSGNVELRAKEMTQQYLREAREKVMQDLPPGSEKRELMEKMIDDAEQKANTNDEDGD